MKDGTENNFISVEMAPMEGITTAVYRSVYRKWFEGTDRMYTPFLVANQTHKFKTREKKEIGSCPPDLVPQILTDRAEHFVWALRELQKAGFCEVNLNAGCPSATVTTKKKGAGMLADINALRSFLDEVFIIKEREDLPEISVKTRVGVSSYSEAKEIADLYAAYPFSKVIVHPRIRDDLYNNTPSPDAFNIFYERIPNEILVFNGDLRTTEDVRKIREIFPGLSHIMVGRGLLADPFLPKRILRCEDTGGDVFSVDEKKTLLGFLEELYEEYERELSEGTAVLKMKDLWNFMEVSFPEQKKQLKAIRKSRSGSEYRMAVRSIFF
ncbi:MAG: tRNA-dihydrouridine synthase family protein [Lachnospiraceae bacterium]|nr:tRNA-dihydrouridine synthase family protein [Lachnospiraceae bacterium]